ncbi:MAG: hypothetical protein HOQ02_06395 [Lysobacter sp.]|nr:hypothetical protein [Lysobacter sp.]
MATTQPRPPVSPSHHPAHTESQSAYWRAHHDRQAYARDDRPYEHYEAAYRTGIEGHAEQGGGDFDAHAVRLRSNYETRPGAQLLGWDQGASLACRAAWDLAEEWQRGDLGRQT